MTLLLLTGGFDEMLGCRLRPMKFRHTNRAEARLSRASLQLAPRSTVRFVVGSCTLTKKVQPCELHDAPSRTYHDHSYRGHAFS